MRITANKDRSGIALIIVLIVIVMLGILAGGFAYSMKVETTLARHASFSSQLDWLGRGGVELSKWILAMESSGQAAQYDSLKSYWAGGPGETNGALAELAWPLKIGNGEIDRPKFVDSDRKFNINRADEVILRQGLTMVGVDAGSFTTIVGSILDWRDPDDNPHMGGTESETYEQQDPPYFAKNGPIDDLSELLLIRGITPAMYWGSSGGGLPQIFNRQAGGGSKFEEPSYAVGLVDLFTPLSGPLGVNINTASATVLQMVPIIDENIAQAIIQARAGLDGQDGTEDDMPFRNPAINLPGLPPGFQIPPGIFSVKSQVFEVTINASIGSSKRQYIAVLRRLNAKDIVVLNMYWK